MAAIFCRQQEHLIQSLVIVVALSSRSFRPQVGGKPVRQLPGAAVGPSHASATCNKRSHSRKTCTCRMTRYLRDQQIELKA